MWMVGVLVVLVSFGKQAQYETGLLLSPFVAYEDEI